MKTIYFENYEEMACAVADKLDEIIVEDEFNDIAIIAKYEEARQIIKELLCIGCDLHSIELHDELWDDYTDEYIISVNKTCDEYEVWCEPFFRESGYLTDDSKVIYVLSNCSSKVFPYCKGETVYKVSVGEESECDDECCCDCVIKENDKKSIYTTSKVEYKVNGRNTTKEEYKEALSNIEGIYLNNMKDMLLRYADFMDEWNDLLRMK